MPRRQKGESFFRQERKDEVNSDYSETFNCWLCGEAIEIRLTEPMERVFCEDCFNKHKNDHKEIVNQYAELKLKIMFENAIRLMEKSGKIYIHEYQKAAYRVQERVNKEPNKFMSSDEIITAIILEEFGLDYEINYKVLNYSVDFYLPGLMVCLEIDGDRHKGKYVYDNNRDIDIRNALGTEWEIVRIPIRFVRKDPSKIIEAAEKLAEEKRRLRKSNSGIIPLGFSERENKHYESIFKN